MMDDKTKIRLCLEMIGGFYNSGLEGSGALEAILNAVYTVLDFYEKNDDG